jgi:hypothetical protein
MKKISLLALFLMLGLVLSTGCTGPATPASATPVPTTPVDLPVTPLVTPSPIPTMSPPSTPSSVPSPTPVQTPPPPGQVTPVTTPRIAVEPPFLEYLNFRKNTFINPIPNCLMQNAFPAIATDNGYGIKREVPKLIALSEDDYFYFLRKFTEGNAENTPVKTLGVCQGSANEPTWNFVEVRVVLNPVNPVAADYKVTRNVWSDKKLVATITTTERLVVDQKASLVSYIPVRTNEMDLIDSISVTTLRS